jgi:hypothetical protein
MLKIITKTSLHLGIAVALSSSLVIGEAYSEIIYANGNDGLPLGLVSDDQIKTNWRSRYAKGPDEGRVEVVSDAQSGNGLRIKYPAFGNQSSPSGATWETDLRTSKDEMYLSYWVKVDADFDFVKGGKLPGLAGGTEFPRGDNNFTTRLMWREEGKLEFYVHGYTLPNAQGKEPTRIFWDDFGEHARLQAGQWHHIELYQKLNTPGVKDGILRGWLDGQLVAEDTDGAGVRDEGQNNTRINYLYFSTFFGGSSAPEIQWQPKADVYATFDDFIVSTTRMGMTDFPGDTDTAPQNSSDETPVDDSPNGEAPIDDTPIDSDTQINTSCQNIAVRIKHEIDLAQGNCLIFDKALTNRKVAVWDSNFQECDFRGLVSSEDGQGTLNVPDNYEATNSISGQRLRITNNVGNACQYLVIRAL